MNRLLWKLMMENQISNLKNQSHNSKMKNEFMERCYRFSIAIIHLAKDLPEKRIYWTVSDQLVRSATSIGANIIEGESASSKRDFIKYYEIALKSANETKYWLGLLRDALDVDKTKISTLMKETSELAKILAASLLTMKGKNKI
jgi:four helix bundle protein